MDYSNSSIGTPPHAADSSLRLRHAIENKFPYLIARAFYQLRGIDDWRAEIPQLASVLGVTLEHLAILALAEYLSSPKRDAELNERLLQTFQKPLSYGTWAGVIREVLTYLRGQQGYTFFAPQLPDLYFPRAGQQGTKTIKEESDALVQLRNDLLRRTAGVAPNRTDQQRFKRQIAEFLQLLSFLKDYPLVSVKSTRTQSGVKTHVCYLHMGFHDMFDQSNVQCDLDLESAYPAMINPGGNELLYLYPFYVLGECEKPGCGAAHLFHFQKLDKRGIDYIFTGDHRLRNAEAGEHLAALLRGEGETPLRQQARYLYMQSADTWHQLPVGSRVGGKYEIVEHLRRGGMADVYKVKLMGGDTYLALKLLPFQFLSDRKMVQRFRQEAAQARELEHPNITRVIDEGEDLVDNYIVMELASGWRQQDGRVALDAGELPKPVSEQVAVEIIKQACEGLHYIHRQGIVHRDIKPGNLLLFEGGQVKLADFGIARSREAMTLTSTGLAMGTPEYMSPEQSEGTKELTTASDIYSLGVVLYELLSGKPPFKRATPLATVFAHLNAPVPPIETPDTPISDELQAIVLKCLEKDPAKRFRSARALFKVLLDYEDQEIIEHRTNEVSEPPEQSELQASMGTVKVQSSSSVQPTPTKATTPTQEGDATTLAAGQPQPQPQLQQQQQAFSSSQHTIRAVKLREPTQPDSPEVAALLGGQQVVEGDGVKQIPTSEETIAEVPSHVDNAPRKGWLVSVVAGGAMTIMLSCVLFLVFSSRNNGNSGGNDSAPTPTITTPSVIQAPTLLSATTQVLDSSPVTTITQVLDSLPSGCSAVQLSYWTPFTGPDGPFMQTIVESFNAANQNIQVQMTTQAEYGTQLQTAAAAGTLPDVAVINEDRVATEAFRNILRPMDEVAGKMGYTAADFPEVAWKAGEVAGKRYAFPLSFVAMTQYYNQDLMTAAGITSPPKTREEFEKAAQAMTSGPNKGFMITTDFPVQQIFQQLLHQYGGNEFSADGSKATWNSDAGVQALAWMRDAQSKYSEPALPVDAELNAFKAGMVGIVWNGIWQIPNVTGEAVSFKGMAGPVPQIGTQPAVWAGGPLLGLPAQRNVDPCKDTAAGIFIKYVLDNSLEWAKAGNIPALNRVRNSAEFKALPHSSIGPTLENPVFPPAIPGIDAAFYPLSDAVAAVMAGQETDIKKALDDAAAKADAILAENKQTYGDAPEHP